MNPSHAEALKEKAHALALLEAPRGLLPFLDHVVVDAQPVKRPFRHIAETWQWERVERSRAAIEQLAGLRQAAPYAGPLSFWNEYHKGSDKTHDTAREVIWLLAFSRRQLNMYVCAGTEDQAALLTLAMRGVLRDNPWLEGLVGVTELTATGRSGSRLKILSMNSYGSQGIFPDYILAEEVTHWKHDEGLNYWNFVLSSANKRPSCVLKVNTNAGHKGSWQWREMLRVSESPYWTTYRAPIGKPLPTWMNQEKIDDDSKGMDPGERDRLYKNRWVDPGEERGYLTLEDSLACVDPLLQERQLGDRAKGRVSPEYVVALDYGGVNDRCALCVLHVEPGTDRVVVDRLDCWQGTHKNRIPVNVPEDDSDARSVEGWLEIICRSFRVLKVVMDPAQLEGLAIKFERRGLWVERFEFRGGKNNYRMAQLLRNHVQNRKIRWSPRAGLLPERDEDGKFVDDPTFAQELSLLVKRDMSYGYRFDHESGRHDDRASAVGMALVHALPDATPAGSQGPKPVGRDPDSPAIRAFALPERDYASAHNIMGVNYGRR